MSLDVLEQPPSVSQIEDLSNVSDTEPLPDALLNGLLSDPKFTEQVVRRHRAYLWPNLSNIEVLRREQRLTASRGIWWNSIRSQHRTGTRDRLPCLTALPRSGERRNYPYPRREWIQARRLG